VTDAWRCFVAVPLPERLRTALSVSVGAWREEAGAPALRWTAPDGWHVTLAFLGATDPTLVPALAEALRAALPGWPAWTAPAGGLGAFPRAARARVLWYRVEDPSGALGALASAVRDALQPIAPSLREAQSFRAHVTLARARDPGGTDLRAWLEERPAPAAALPVDRVILFRSHLGAGPARYEALETVPLAGGNGGMIGGVAESGAEVSVDG